MALDSAGNLYIADGEHVVRKVSTSGIISTVVGAAGDDSDNGDGGAASAARTDTPRGIAVDSNDNYYISNAGTNCYIRKVTVSTGIISTVAGAGNCANGADGGAATSTSLNNVTDMVIDSSGNIYLAERDGHKIRKINTSGIISTVAGTGVQGFSGDGGQATSAQLDTPLAIAMDRAGDLYFADSNNHRIRKITMSTGVISTVAGNGTATSTGDGGQATSATIKNPFIDVGT